MQAQEFIVQTMNATHTNHTQILLQDEYLKSLHYFGENLDLIFQQYIKLSVNEKKTFIENIANLLPLSKKIFAMCIEHTDAQENLTEYLKDANEKYLDILFDCFGGTRFEDTYVEIETDIDTLNNKLEELDNNYLLNTKKRESLKKELEETIQKNTQEIQEIENLEKEKHSLETSVKDYTSQIATSKQEVNQLETQITGLKEELESFATTKEIYEQELHTLSKKQQEHSTKVQEIAKEREKLQAIADEYEKEKATLDAMQKSIESKQEDIDIVKNRYQYYTDKGAKEIQKKLKEMDEYLQTLFEHHSIVTQEDEIVNKAIK